MKEYEFYIVPTPIGNLGDITNRAIEVLKQVDIIACEDSRVTQKLLNHFDIRTKCISYHKYNEKERLHSFLEILQSGKKMALVSDAGTPLICDPGAVLVEELRKNNIKITALPGANAVVTFLSTVFYDSPNRIMKTLSFIKNVRPDARIALGRELTKVFEEVVIDNVDSVIEYFEKNIIKGEIVAMVYRSENTEADSDIDDKIAILKSKNFSAKDISIILSELYGLNKNDVYKKVLNSSNNM